jgi:hypothetical protein
VAAPFEWLAVTMRARQRRGPVAVFDPQHLASGRRGGQPRASPSRGAADLGDAVLPDRFELARGAAPNATTASSGLVL